MQKTLLNIKCSEDELNEINLIINRINCARQAARPETIPDNVPEQKAKLFIRVSLDALADYHWLEQDWWKNMKKKYNLPAEQNIYIDNTTGDFYIQ